MDERLIIDSVIASGKMSKEKFSAVIGILLPQVIQLICQNESRDEISASKELYASKLYSALEEEETKLWHLSAPALYDIYVSERLTGAPIFPEEA